MSGPLFAGLTYPETSVTKARPNESTTIVGVAARARAMLSPKPGPSFMSALSSAAIARASSASLAPAGNDVAPSGANAALTFNNPRPKIVSVPVAPRSVAAASSAFTICVALNAGNRCRVSATAPATCGAEYEVPLTVVVPPPMSVVTMLTPGATR